MDPAPPFPDSLSPGGHGGLTQPVTGDDGLTTWRSARLCRLAWAERLRASDEGVYRDARNGLALMAADARLPDRERRLAREALLADQRAGESVELDLMKMKSVEARPGAVTVNLNAPLTPEAVRAGSDLLRLLVGDESGRVDVGAY